LSILCQTTCVSMWHAWSKLKLPPALSRRALHQVSVECINFWALEFMYILYAFVDHVVGIDVKKTSNLFHLSSQLFALVVYVLSIWSYEITL